MNARHRGCTFIAGLVHEAPLELVQVCIGLFTLQGGVYIQHICFLLWSCIPQVQGPPVRESERDIEIIQLPDCISDTEEGQLLIHMHTVCGKFALQFGMFVPHICFLPKSCIP